MKTKEYDDSIAFQRVAERVWRAHLTEGEFLEEVRRACANEEIPLSPSTLSESLSESRELSREDVGSLLKNCGPGPEGPRDAAIIILLYGFGLAREELVALEMDDYNLEDKALLVQSPKIWLRTLRKFEVRRLRESRPIVISSESVIDWIKVRGDSSGPLFCHIGKDGALHPSRPIAASKVYQILKTRGEQAGIHPFKAISFRTTGTASSRSVALTRFPTPPLVLQCPHCWSYNHPSEVRCDCGYNFETSEFEFPDVELKSTWFDPFLWW